MRLKSSSEVGRHVFMHGSVPHWTAQNSGLQCALVEVSNVDGTVLGKSKKHLLVLVCAASPAHLQLAAHCCEVLSLQRYCQRDASEAERCQG